MTIRKEVFLFLDSIQNECSISGWQLYSAISVKTGRKTYPTTLLNICRVYADLTGGDFVCVDRKKSIYKFTPSKIKLGDALLSGIE